MEAMVEDSPAEDPPVNEVTTEFTSVDAKAKPPDTSSITMDALPWVGRVISCAGLVKGIRRKYNHSPACTRTSLLLRSSKKNFE